MGVDREDYLMFGVDIGYQDDYWDKFEAEIDGANGRRFDLVYDSMSGNYAIAGKIIAKSDGYDGFEMSKIDPANLNVDKVALAETISTAIGRKLAADEFALILFSHFH